MDLLQKPPPPPAVELQLPPANVDADADMGDINEQNTGPPSDKYEAAMRTALDALHSAVADFRFQMADPEKEQHYSILDHWGEAACCFLGAVRVGLNALKDVGLDSSDAGDTVRRELHNASTNYPPLGDTLDYGLPDTDTHPPERPTQQDNTTSAVLAAIQPLLRTIDRRFSNIKARLCDSDARPAERSSARQPPASQHQLTFNDPRPPAGTHSYATAASTGTPIANPQKEPTGRAPTHAH
ncbi:hypothetical protein WOLCODRAFT_157171 [Wolfiporia cocos MD-104 SS10]|uniref:Uncharacterized protein n=1 Tax=Wolfiporia cocos (strain MD-104) TaxID=742152 RepID=A0A2H3JFK3_WOLCO|nr:hypothetical protein WOLCODRAFT_157171 [Wolfiporia cocos MD-104 SS10]